MSGGLERKSRTVAKSSSHGGDSLLNTLDIVPIHQMQPSIRVGDKVRVTQKFELINATDIAALQAKKSEAQDEQGDLRDLVDVCPEMLCVLSETGFFKYVNPRWIEFLGYAPKKLLSKSWLELVHPDDREEAERVFAEWDRMGCIQIELRIRTKTGLFGWGRWSLAKGANTESIFGSLRDTSEVRRALDRVNLAIEASPNGMLLMGEAGEIVLVNRKMEQLFGYSKDELLGSKIEMLLPERYRRKHISKRTQYFSSPATRTMGQGDLYGTRKDGTEFALEIGLNPLTTEDGPRVLASIVDITERKRTELEIQERITALQRARERKNMLGEMSSLLQHAITEEESLGIVCSFAQKLLRDSEGAIYIVPSSRTGFELVRSWGEAFCSGELLLNDCWAFRRSQPHHSVHGCPPICNHLEESPDKQYLCAPMSAHGQFFGLMSVSLVSSMDLKDVQEVHALVRSIADQLGLALSNIHLRDRLHSLSIRDPLTTLFNRRYMEEMVEREIPRARRRKTQLSVLMLDVDHFKRYNDMYGHQAADLALQKLSTLLQENTRKEDIVCRYGGEELVVILPECDLKAAGAQAESLRKKIQEQSDKKVTVSIGVSAYPIHGESWSEVLRAADRALYLSKSGGRNRVTIVGFEEDES